jgi:hypothetical protein
LAAATILSPLTVHAQNDLLPGLLAPRQPSEAPRLQVSSDVPSGELMVLRGPSCSTWEYEEEPPPQVASDSASGIGSLAGRRNPLSNIPRLVSVVELGSLNSAIPVEIRIDRTVLKASSAVVWIARSRGTVVDSQEVRIALLGDASLEQDGVTRQGPNLYVTAIIRGSIRIEAGSRFARDDSAGQTYQVADNLRRVAETPTERLGSAVVARAAGEPTPPREVTSEDLRRAPIRFTAGYAPTIEAPDGTMAVLLSGGATIFQRRPNGDFLELRADRAVLFTNVRSLKELADAQSTGESRDVITAAYLEGDVRLTYTPNNVGIGSSGPQNLRGLGEQRLLAERVYYEFPTDRAILTDAVLHTIDPQRSLPVMVRAKTVQQLAQGNYNAEQVELSTSQFSVPTYSVRASKMYVRQTPSSNETERARTVFGGDDLTLNALGVPFFYFPSAGGDLTNAPLRSVAFENSDRFGFGARTQWGLFESLGQPHPNDLDASYRVDYLTKRGPATGLDADYKGGLVTETTAEPWNFQGRLQSYLIYDNGTDKFAGLRRDVVPERELRGKILFEHQHFLPEDWQVQIRAGYSSDPTFLEQFFQRDFDTQLPYELAFYAKRQRDSEQLSLLGTTTLNSFPTTADLAQEQTFVQRYPEVAYRRVGDSLLDDRFTLFSDNVGSVLSFKNTTSDVYDPAYLQGYRLRRNPADPFPGFPSFANTGTDESTILRGDAREEIDFPVQLGQFKVVPYATGRYTGYTDSPGTFGSTGAQNRVYAAVGSRITTAFWATDDSAESELFDIHRTRHIIEPVINLYTSGTTVDASRLYIYDEPIDKLYDVSAAQLRLEQRWQTKRGGPGRWRSVDFLTLNVEGNFFTNNPDDIFLNPRYPKVNPTLNSAITPTDPGARSSLDHFRGRYFDSLPETSLARNSINADASWRISDTMLFVADEEYNVDKTTLATAAAGLAVQRDPRLTYYVEQRYVDLLNSNITSLLVSYQLSSKYLLQLQQSYDFSQSNNVSSAVTINRRFDRLVVALTLYNDSINDDTGVRVVLVPEGLSERSTTSFFNATQSPRR